MDATLDVGATNAGGGSEADAPGSLDTPSAQPDVRDADVADGAADQAAVDDLVSEGSTQDALPPVSEGSTHDAAPLSPDVTLSTCTTDLSNSGTGPFTIAFTLKTTTPDSHVALLNQRAWCNATQPYWDLRYSASVGEVEYEFQDGNAHRITGTVDAILNDGMPHQLAFARAEDTLTVEVDGADVSTTDGGTTVRLLAFGDLPMLKSGSDTCDGEDGTVPLDGMITQICISH